MSQALPSDAPEDPPLRESANLAGEALRAAREAAGLTIDIVAQHLKLAPRQVRALEEGNYAELPGRTFVRGFARNYARLLQLDADALVDALPDASTAPALDQPTLGTSTRPMGEFDERPRRSVAWIAIPMLVIGLIGLAAIIEFQRPGWLSLLQPSPPVAPADPVMPPATPGGPLPLPNPLIEGESPPASADAPAGAQTQPAADAAAAASHAAAGPAGAAASAAPPGPARATLVIDYRGAAWTEVRDATGQRLLVGTMPAGTTQTLTGVPPFDVVLGNVAQTTLTWRGTTVDTSAYHKQNVARLHLQ